jgi:hypothetical protein
LRFGLINEGLIRLDSVASNGSFEGNDFEGIRKEVVLDEVEDVSVRLPLETEEYHETFQDDVCLCSGFQPETPSPF